MEDKNEELESFRQEWRAEVSARSKIEGPQASNRGPPRASRRPPPITSLSSSKSSQSARDENEENGSGGTNVHPRSHSFSKEPEHEDFAPKNLGKVPQTALEHYEKAVERESQGSLGDSLSLYRKAYRVRTEIPAISLPLTEDLAGPSS